LVYILLGIYKISSVTSLTNPLTLEFEEVQGILMCLLGFFGILIELVKLMLWFVYPPIIYAGVGWGSRLKQGQIYAKGDHQENSTFHRI